MSSARSRKRRRSEAFANPVNIEVAHTKDLEDPEIQSDDEEKVPDDETDEARQVRLEKEQEVWKSVREEHFEVVDQLALTAQRQISLTKELDQQSHDYQKKLQDTIRLYIAHRRAVAARQFHPTVATESNSNPFPDAHPTSEGASQTSVAEVPIPSMHLRNELVPPQTPATPFLPQERVKEPTTSREMLGQIAWLIEELIKAGEEKVNLAETTHSAVKRHIRLVDHAIAEQRASIQNGAQAYLEKVTMPEKWSSRPQNVMSDDSEDELPLPPNAEPEIIAPPEPTTARRGKKKQSTAPAEEQSTSLKITLPAAPITYTPESTDPDEPKYCYCERISFGEMIACDNPPCKIEWFHLSCTGLTEVPSQSKKWYCDHCKASRKSGKRKR
ncbi:uncharacterized protein BT62DRAFT_998967 [Guyanagaster necrorhizus]|uniref:Chromatin modification-related protein n=1 Tax=Guyanagaster necrorhizus TaxID=856835 RepID=A0A9P7W5Q3_9AGAR|nr:uncharacterized protein BT62DRAFT_998967 [Guyanagaster necrorhizus MCA 3950]KAG7452950.1 hypothetical protein BT62DRAFT_998967 [Guyanagaster necrorhizus MCA 3950]